MSVLLVAIKSNHPHEISDCIRPDNGQKLKVGSYATIDGQTMKCNRPGATPLVCSLIVSGTISPFLQHVSANYFDVVDAGCVDQNGENQLANAKWAYPPLTEENRITTRWQCKYDSATKTWMVKPIRKYSADVDWIQ